MSVCTFGRNGPNGDSGVAIPGRSLMSINALFYTAIITALPITTVCSALCARVYIHFATSV